MEIADLLDLLDPHARGDFLLDADRFRGEARAIIERLPDPALRRRLLQDLFGWGPLQTLVDDPDVTEVSFNSSDSVYITRRDGRRYKVDLDIPPGQMWKILESQLSRAGVQLSQFSPLADALISDQQAGGHMRITARAPSATSSCDGQFTLRRQVVQHPTLELFEGQGILDRRTGRLLAAAVRAGKSVLVAGSMGVGKTTVLSALYLSLPDHLRVATIEEVAELPARPGMNTAIGLVRRAGVEGGGGISFADLLRAELRNGPDVLLLGEIRGAEGLSLLQAMHTFRQGCMGTIHGSSSEGALQRFVNLVREAGLPADQAEKQIASAVFLVVYVGIDRATGERRILEVARPRMTPTGIAAVPVVRFEDGRWDVLDLLTFTDLNVSFEEQDP